MRPRVPPFVPILLFTAAPLAAQLPDTTYLDRARADALTGLYELDDGRVVHLLDLRDQLDGRPTLSMLEYGSGRLRALYPTEDGAFEAGNAWFARDSVEYRVRFHEAQGGDAPASGLRWEEDGRTIEGRRPGFVEHEVEISSGDVTLAGTLVLPPGEGPHPAVVMVPGSGPLTRRAPRYVGDLLALHGVAVLATDKRGTGESSGDWNGLSHAEWADDVEAELDFLRARPEIDAGRLGLFASSEAGFVAPTVAARRRDVRFLVCRVCSALPHPVVIADDNGGRLRRRGLEPEDVERGLELLRRLMRYALDRTGYDSLVGLARSGEGTAWREIFPPAEIPSPDATYWDTYRGVLEVDPAPLYRALDIPVLAILGERDDRLPVDKHRRAFETLAAEGTDLELWVIPGATHGLLLTGPDGAVTRYPPGLHDRIARWVAEHAGVEPR